MKEGDLNSKKIEDDVSLLRQLVNSLDDFERKLEEYYKSNDPDNFNRAKKFVIQIHDKISEVTK